MMNKKSNFIYTHHAFELKRQTFDLSDGALDTWAMHCRDRPIIEAYILCFSKNQYPCFFVSNFRLIN